MARCCQLDCLLLHLHAVAPCVMFAVLSKHVPVGMPSDLKRFSDVAIKANVLLQCHFSRQPLSSELRYSMHAVSLLVFV